MGSISKAGTNLFISQQTVSRQIKALETELDMPLFERMNRGVRLTPQGERNLISQLERAAGAVSHGGGSGEGYVLSGTDEYLYRNSGTGQYFR